MTKRVLITGARAPIAVEFAILFSRIGVEVHVADSTPLLFAAGLNCVTAGHKLPPARDNFRAYGAAVAELVERLGIDLVVPTCEEIFFLAAARDGGQPIPLLAPSFATLQRLHDKFSFIELAAQLGLAVPETRLLSSAKDLDEVAPRSFELVFKPCYSRFAIETKIGVTAGELKRIHPTPEVPWIAQELLRGEEFCTYAIALHGKLGAFCAYRPLYRMGPAAGYYFEPVDLPGAEQFTRQIVEATGFHGQIAFDMIMTRDRGLLPIECNPRGTSGLHLLAQRSGLAERIADWASQRDLIRLAPDAGPAAVRAAMWLYGLLPAIAQGKFRRWRQDKNRARDVFAVPGNSLNLRAWGTLGIYCLEAMKTRRPLRAVAAADIEWNGEPLNADA